ncbi:hypothetical protein TNCV_3470191 [Trichonephila clavipes]|nr:hypothetical protein TNCV_3470191 [Trichonephila clavipes]
MVFQEEREQNSSQNAIEITLYYNCASNDDQRGINKIIVKINGTPDHNSWLRACAACNSESRIGTWPWASPGMSSMIFGTQLKAEFFPKHYTFTISMIPT